MTSGGGGSVSSSPMRMVVTAADAAASAEWVRVAARAFPLLGTVSKAKRARKRGELTLNGSALVPTNVAAAAGDEIAYAPSEAAAVAAESESESAAAETRRWAAVCARQGLRRVFEDGDMALVVKPAGVHVKGRGVRTVERALAALLAPAGPRVGGAALPRPHAVHRLDARVGGLLLVAKTRAAEVALAAQLERHAVSKRYRAVLAGRAAGLAARAGVSRLADDVALPGELRELARAGEPELFLVRGEVEGRPSATAVRLVGLSRSARYEWLSTVDLWPLTGRRHQLRVHMARLGLPVVGDDLHHADALPPVVRGLGLFLFAVGVAFDDVHCDGSRRRFEIDEPPKFAQFRRMCELNWRRRQNKRVACEREER